MPRILLILILTTSLVIGAFALGVLFLEEGRWEAAKITGGLNTTIDSSAQISSAPVPLTKVTEDPGTQIDATLTRPLDPSPHGLFGTVLSGGSDPKVLEEESLTTTEAANELLFLESIFQEAQILAEFSNQDTDPDLDQTSRDAQIVDPIKPRQEEGNRGNNGETDSSRIFGAMSSQEENPQITAAPTALPSPTDSPILQRLTGQARGFVLLPLMHQRARAANEVQIDTMLRSQVQELYTSILVDGTFGTDIGYLASVVQRLNTDGRSLTLVLYLANGPTMREYDTTTIETAFSWINPITFRNLIQYDGEVRDAFQQIVRAASPLWELNSQLNPTNRNIGIVMLEDNLDRPSYQAMRQIAQSVAPSTVEFLRNPCPGCFSGNDSDSVGDRVELHAPANLESLGFGDGYTLDGVGYGYPGARAEGEWDLETLKRFLDQSVSQGVSFFGLWRASRQGNYSQVFAHPDERIYEVPSLDQVQIDIELLRHGLRPIEELR